MTDISRSGGRQADQLRPLKIELGVNVHAEGSCLIEMGRTRVWITASVEDRVPQHRRNTGQGWITAEWKPSENNRRAKYYSLTRLGRQHLEKEAANWSRLSAAISHVVRLEEA